MGGSSFLVTGGAGFIGSHLTEALLARGHAVTVLDDLSTGRRANLQSLESNPRLRVIVAPVCEPGLLEREVPRHERVYHLASAVGVKLVIEQPVRTVETIFNAANLVLKACARHRRPVLITSTSEVYGKSEAVPFREEADVVLGPTGKRRWAYACAKALGEFLALAHFHESRLPVFIVRLFNTVGPRQTGRYGMVLPTFVEQALAGRPVTVYGDGKQRRCFCSVFDVLEALIALPMQEKAAGQVVNVGRPEEVAIEELARRVIRLSASRSRIEYVPYEQAYGADFDDMTRRVPDLTRITSLTGWRPKHTLDEIIRQVIEEKKRAPEGTAMRAEPREK